MHIMSIQSLAGGTGGTLTAAELSLDAIAEGQAVLVVDISPYGLLKDDLEVACFQFLEDVRQLFRPLKEARWQLSDMRRYGILHYPKSQPDYVTQLPDGKCQMAFREKAGREPDALFNLWRNVAWFYKHYNLMIVDVAAKDQLLMQYFHNVADEEHVMLRASGAGRFSIGDWCAYIERPEGQNNPPKMIAHGDRNMLATHVDSWSRSTALRSHLEAARFPKRRDGAPRSIPSA